MMNDEDFQDYLNNCYKSLERKQKALLDNYGFGSLDQFNHDFEKEEIYFLRDDTLEVKAKITPIGSCSAEVETWVWAWADDAFPDNLRMKSEKLKELESMTGFEMFSSESIQVDEDMVWEITAMALELLGSEGAYKAPINDVLYFYALSDVQKVIS